MKNIKDSIKKNVDRYELLKGKKTGIMKIMYGLRVSKY